MNGITYSALAVIAGEVRRVWFEAAGETEARELCRELKLGYEGAAARPKLEEMAPVALDEKAALKALGGVSRATLYRMLIRGDLLRLPGSRRLLITRSSIERLAR